MIYTSFVNILKDIDVKEEWLNNLKKLNVASQQVLHHVLPMPWWVHTTLSLVGGIYVPVLVHRFLNHHKEHHAYKRAILFLLGHK